MELAGSGGSWPLGRVCSATHFLAYFCAFTRKLLQYAFFSHIFVHLCVNARKSTKIFNKNVGGGAHPDEGSRAATATSPKAPPLARIYLLIFIYIYWYLLIFIDIYWYIYLYSKTSITRNNFLSYFRFLVAATAVWESSQAVQRSCTATATRNRKYDKIWVRIIEVPLYL